MGLGQRSREETVQATDVRRFANLLFQVVHQISTRSFQGGTETEEESSKEADEKGDREHGGIGSQIHDDRKIHRTEKAA